MDDRPHAVERSRVLPSHAGGRTGPRITVVGPLWFTAMSEHTGELIEQLTRTALEELAALDADWRFVDTAGDVLPAYGDLLDTDGLLVLGGGDVDSELYGVPGPAPHEYGADAEVDEWQLGSLRAAVDAGVPVLALCRGLQLLNVAYGGTLVPDIDPPHLHHGPSDELFLDEPVTVVEGTRLAAVLGAGQTVVRGGHHQAVDAVAPGLVVAAYADDGMVEALEHPDRWVLGVQWHPEETRADPAARRTLFSALLATADSR